MRTVVLAVLLLPLAGCRNVQYPESTGEWMCSIPYRPMLASEERATPGFGLLVRVTPRGDDEPLVGAVVWHEHGHDTTDARGMVVVPPSRTLKVQFIGYCDGWVRLKRTSGNYVRVELREGE